MSMSLTAEELLAGSAITHEVEIPADIIHTNGTDPCNSRVVLRPLTVRDLQRIGKAAREDEDLSAALMIGLLSSFIPAWNASRTSIVESLSYTG